MSSLSEVENIAGDLSETENIIGNIDAPFLGSSSGGNTKFSTLTPINNPIGQFKINQEYAESDGLTLNDAINKMLHIDVATTVVLSSTNSGTHEVGTIIDTPTLTATITQGTAIPTKIEFYKEDILLSEQEYVEGTNNYSFTTENVMENTTFRVKVYYYFVIDEIQIANASVSYNYYSASYYGIMNTNEYSGDLIKAGTKTIKSSKSLTYNGIIMTNKYVFYAYPKYLGILSSCKDINGFEVLSSFSRSETNIDGVPYYMYIMTDSASLQNGKLVFS